MNIKITHKWLLEYLDTTATPQEIQKYLSLSGPSIEKVEKLPDGDVGYDIEITSNRVDTASVLGVAREAATILTRFGIKSTFKEPQCIEPKLDINTPLSIDIRDDSGSCKRILAVVMDNVSVSPSSDTITKRLEYAGIRSLNNLIDITNYVMMEIGHPTHVFDYDRIELKKLIIRSAKDKECIETLDHKKYSLSKEDIIIDDGTGTVIDLPGIMGTANSVVTRDTKRILFFIESNDPRAIRRSSMRYGIRTMAATINEKSPDPEDAKKALLRGVELYKKLTNARVASNVVDIYPSPRKPKNITTTISFINKRIGIDIPSQQVTDILKGLGFKVMIQGDTITLEVPSFRYEDMNIPEDVVEEVARIYGYDNLPNNLSPMKYIKQPKEMEDLFVYQNKIKLFLKHLGLHEVLNYSMISLAMIENCGMDQKKHLYLSNVMSDEIKYLRISLLPSLIRDIKINEGRQQTISFFEVAKVYWPTANDLPTEKFKLGIGTNSSFLEIKGILEALFNDLHIDNYSFKKGKDPLFAGTQAEIQFEDTSVGRVGQLKSTYVENNKLTTTCFLAELDFETVMRFAKTIAVYVPPHPYAVIKLDYSMKLNPLLDFAAIKRKAFLSSKHLQKIEYISSYENKIAFRLYFSSKTHNLTENEAKIELENIVANLN